MKIAKGSTLWLLNSILLDIIVLIAIFIFENKIKIYLTYLLLIILIITILLFIFFRDPTRAIGKEIVAPADGKIQNIKNIKDKEIGNCVQISIFMNIYNVHVNRMPLDGHILKIVHKYGSHIPAFKKESEKNERLIITIKTKIGKIKIIQIAGTIARRIKPYIKEGDKLKKGDKIGIIKLGSRVDIFIPKIKIKKINVKIGEKIKAGENTIAEIND